MTGDQPAAHRGTLRERFEGRVTWWLLLVSSLLGFVLGFATNVGSSSMAYSLGIGLISGGLLGFPVLILIGLDRLRASRRQKADLAARDNRE